MWAGVVVGVGGGFSVILAGDVLVDRVCGGCVMVRGGGWCGGVNEVGGGGITSVMGWLVMVRGADRGWISSPTDLSSTCAESGGDKGPALTFEFISKGVTER